MAASKASTNNKVIAYLRVSTGRQGRSGLGLESQREAIARYAAGAGLEIVGEFLEVETGKGVNALAKRPQLLAALQAAKCAKAKIAFAKLDRLARNVAFISALMETGVDFVVADMPNADRFMLHLYAALGEQEALVIGSRTRAALQAAKARGTALGTHGKVLAASNKAEAMERLAPLVPVLTALRDQGFSLRAMVENLNSRNIQSPAGGRWHLANLHRAMGRVAGVGVAAV